MTSALGGIVTGVTDIQTSGDTETLVRHHDVGGGTSHRAHFVKRPHDNVSASAHVTEARVMGFEVEALCGYRWIPARDPNNLPICGVCRDLLSETL